jgi:hypothetical protein
MEDKIPVCCFSDYNVSCPYVWFNQDANTWDIELVKHSLPDEMDDLRVSIQYPATGETKRFLFSLSRCGPGVPTARLSSFTLVANETGLQCTLDEEVHLFDQFPVSFTVLVTFANNYCQAVLFRPNRRSLQPVFLHSLL